MIRLARIITGLLFASIIATHRMVSVRSCPSILRMLVSLRSLRIRHFIASLSETCIETLRTSVLTSPDVSSPSLQHLTSSDPALRSQSPKIERPQGLKIRSHRPEPKSPRDFQELYWHEGAAEATEPAANRQDQKQKRYHQRADKGMLSKHNEGLADIS